MTAENEFIDAEENVWLQRVFERIITSVFTRQRGMACLQGQVLLFAIFVTATIVDNVAQDPVNLALNKIATASTFENSPQLAVDGNLSPYHRDGSCFYTPFASALQWISVDLGDSYIITSVNVTNRGDCCGE
ncbi:fucolectin-3-like [Haliotis rufescens]|uniref:fucolectin-3-like n=1 Tax=Haliotis rufescens TaxID=6454 RepID=UPI00201F34C5|nr:fucolectin-3-like [Haliotis rufescens]